jgi:hypothetical protein
MVDAAIERIAREHGLSRIGGPESSMTTPVEHALHNHPTRLRWKGLDVSEEFRDYAERVARGEELPPFEGRVLAEPNSAFPWGAGTPVALRSNREGRAGRTALWASAIAVLGLLAWSMALRVETAADEEDAALAASEAVLALQAQRAASPAADPVPVELQQEPIPALPPDVVNVPAVGSAAPAVAAGESLVAVAPSAASGPLPAASAVSTLAAIAPRAITSAPLAASVAALPRGADVAPAAAPPAASGALLPARAAGETERTAVAAAKVDEFGIIVDSPSSFAAQATVAQATVAQATAAKTNAGVGSVGDLARAGQASGGSVRKEPGGESSAKGSLLVENPSF